MTSASSARDPRAWHRFPRLLIGLAAFNRLLHAPALRDDVPGRPRDEHVHEHAHEPVADDGAADGPRGPVRDRPTARGTQVLDLTTILHRAGRRLDEHHEHARPSSARLRGGGGGPCSASSCCQARGPREVPRRGLKPSEGLREQALVRRVLSRGSSSGPRTTWRACAFVDAEGVDGAVNGVGNVARAPRIAPST